MQRGWASDSIPATVGVDLLDSVTMSARRLLTLILTERWDASRGAGPMPEETWQQLVDRALMDRVIPTLAAAVNRSLIIATDQQQAQITALRNEVTVLCLRIETVLLWLHDEFEARGIEFLVLKGAAVSHLDYEQQAERQFGDLDLLIHPADLPEALAVLTKAGFTRRYQEFRPGFDTRYSKSVSVTASIEIDLHRTLAHGPVGFRIPVGALWEATDTFDVAGRTFAALDAPTRLVHSCLHSYLDPPPPRLSNLLDIHRQMHANSADPCRVAERAAELGVQPEVFSALSLAIGELYYPKTLADGWLVSAAPRPLDAALAASHRHAHTSSSTRSLLSVFTMTGVRDRLRFLSWLIVPWGRTVGDTGIDRISRFRLTATRIVAGRRRGS